jgi:NADH:ubiquinone oxidoreductase subunit C
VEKNNMDTAEALSWAEEILKPFSRHNNRIPPDRLDVTIPMITIEPAVRALAALKWGNLSAITGLDHPGSTAVLPEEQQWSRLSGESEDLSSSTPREGSIEILYHFCRKAAIVTLRINVRYSAPVIPTICGILPAATLYERELIEMFGIQVVGTPNKDRLLLPDDWPYGVYPLRKSFKGLQSAQSGGGE